MKIIYPKPIRKSAHVRREEFIGRLAPSFLLVASLMIFYAAMQTIPYVVRLASEERATSELGRFIDGHNQTAEEVIRDMYTPEEK